MLVDIQAFFFNTLVNTQAVSELDAVEEGESAGSSPEVNHQNAEALSTEESPAVTVEGAVRSRQQACQQRTQDAADTVN